MAAKAPADSSKLIPLPCGVCSTIPPTSADQFCRSCGQRLSLECSQCTASMRVEDRFCPACGHRRIAIFDVFRYGIRGFRAPGFVLLTAAAVGSAWLLLRYSLRNRL